MSDANNLAPPLGAAVMLFGLLAVFAAGLADAGPPAAAGSDTRVACIDTNNGETVPYTSTPSRGVRCLSIGRWAAEQRVWQERRRGWWWTRGDGSPSDQAPFVSEIPKARPDHV